MKRIADADKVTPGELVGRCGNSGDQDTLSEVAGTFNKTLD